MKYHLRVPLLKQEKIAKNTYALTVKADPIVQKARPGQFVHLRITQNLDPLLRRPLSINSLNKETGELTFWYQVIGKGTALLSQLSPGDTLDIMGPLGNGFQTDFSGKKIGLIAGGIGIAPLVFLFETLSPKNTVKVFWGGKSKNYLPALNLSLEMITEDGSSGRKGLVTELLTESFDLLFACGPQPMLKAVTHFAFPKGIPLQVSLESVMACGVGACLGCIVKGSKKQFKVCQDGPVFWADDVFGES
jgi:dihydroorotate dehydrogenase electron transfer subunit